MPTTPSKEEAELITRAYEFAKRAHEGHTRYSGDPYFNHVEETAKILAEFGVGAKTIGAGLLHDSIEDVGTSEEEVKEKFGDEILFLVKGVTKLGRLKYRGVERHVGSLQKLFVATSQDIRVLFIKFADRLHNLRTLEYVPEEKRQRIALETLEIYAPLAYRLGVRKLHRELEDLAFKYAYPEDYEKVLHLLKQTSEGTSKRLDKIMKSIKKAFAKEGMRNIRTECRVKGIYSLYKKLQRKDWDMDKVYDIGAVRLIVPSVNDCYRALGVIHGTWRPLPNRIRDYIAFEKPNGYKSLHTTIFTGDGSIVEVQIRTEKMHRGAEYGIASHISYKEGFKKKMLNPSFVWIRQLLPYWPGESVPADENTPSGGQINVPLWLKQLVETQQNITEPQDFIKTLKADFFEHRIFVFTPKGDVVDLPVGSSPIDFAYAIHSDIGDHMAGAKVNGKLVSLETKLENGNIVNIDTKESSHPTQKWIDVAKTSIAKKSIKAFLSKEAA